jgi:RNA polymerase-binding transcription factor DksA
MISTAYPVRPDGRPELARYLPGIRMDLEQQRSFRIDQLDELRAATGNASTPALDEPRLQVAAAMSTAAIRALADIDAALHRLAAGSYGRCEVCDRSIPIEQLESVPMISRCVHCRHSEE